jgi:hypothetical protein
MIPGLLLDFLYLLPLVILTLAGITGEPVGSAGALLALGVLLGGFGALGAFLLGLRRQRRGELLAPRWWGAPALVFPWATYLTFLTRRDFAAGEQQDPWSFPTGATTLLIAAVLLFATGAFHGLLGPLLDRLQEVGLGGLEAARNQAAELGRQAARAQLEVAANSLRGADAGLGALASGAQHLSGLSLVAAAVTYALESLGRFAWAFALPVLLPAGLLFLLPALWRETQVTDKLAGFGSRLVLFALAFHLFVPLAGAAAQAATAYMPGGEALATAGLPQDPAGLGSQLRNAGLYLLTANVLVPLLVLWGLGWGLRRMGRPLRRIYPEKSEENREEEPEEGEAAA